MKTILIALGVLALTPAAAHATTVTYAADGALVVTAGPGEKNDIGLQQDDGDAGKVVVYEGGSGVAISGPCEPLGNAQVCSVDPAAGVRVDLGDGDDWGYVSMFLPASLRVSIAGGAGNDKLQGDVQATTLDGGPGNDTLQGGDGDDNLLGGDGNDTLEGRGGADSLSAGAGDDDIDAGYGDDTITGGPGRDRISGDLRSGGCGPVWCDLPFGNDTIHAQDGEPDSISCGYGQDTVYADAADVVAGDCEQVIRSGEPAPSGADGGGTTTTPTPATRHRPVLVSLRMRGRSLLVRARYAAKVRVAVQHARTRTVKLRHGRATVALGRLSHGRHRVSATPLGAHGEAGKVRRLTFKVR